MGLHCYALEEYSNEEEISLREREDANIRLLKPVLNTQVPKDCTCYMENIWNMVEAVTQADENGKWSFEGCREIW